MKFSELVTYFDLRKDKKKNSKKKDKIFGNLGILNDDEVMELAEKLIAWYNIKFPDNDLEVEDGNVFVIQHDFRINNSQMMDISELFNRLTFIEKEALKCDYKTCFNSSITNFFYKKLKNINSDSMVVIVLRIDKSFSFKGNKFDSCVVVSDNKGKILYSFGDVSLSQLIGLKYNGKSLEQLLDVIKNIDNCNIDYSLLSDCVMNKKNDIVVRGKIVDYVALHLVYQAKDYQYGYFRACEFLNDFNKCYSLEIDDKYLDKLLDSNIDSYDKKYNKKKSVKDKSLVKKKTTY